MGFSLRSNAFQSLSTPDVGASEESLMLESFEQSSRHSLIVLSSIAAVCEDLSKVFLMVYFDKVLVFIHLLLEIVYDVYLASGVGSVGVAVELSTLEYI